MMFTLIDISLSDHLINYKDHEWLYILIIRLFEV